MFAKAPHVHARIINHNKNTKQIYKQKTSVHWALSIKAFLKNRVLSSDLNSENDTLVRKPSGREFQYLGANVEKHLTDIILALTTPN